MPDRKQSSKSYLFVGLLSVAVYTNTLIGGFTFDDNFAVIYNGDVTNDNNPVMDLFRHDFWGQDITSQQSHKSFRPITILVFRWTRQAWDVVQKLLPGINSQILSPAPVLQGTEQRDVFTGRSPRPPGLHPFPFHVLSVLLHSVASMMVFALAEHLFAKLEQVTCGTANTSCSEAMHSSNSSSMGDAATAVGSGVEWPIRRPRGLGDVLDKWLMWSQQPALWRVPCSSQGQLQALAAAVLFALHPIHTEAVAGVVGCAELICAVWSLPALLLYCMAVDGRYAAAGLLQQHISDCRFNTVGNTHPAFSKDSSTSAGVGSKAKQQQQQQRDRPAPGGQTPGEQRLSGLTALCLADSLQHWLLVLTAACLAALAALSKEIGITIVGTMMLYDLLMAPHMVAYQRHSSSSSSQPPQVMGQVVHLQQQLLTRRCRFQVVRVMFLLLTAVSYVKLRSWVAVQQLVAIYRKVENPIPFAESLSTRIMSTGYLHARYFGQLLLPLHLSADWSFSCIPLVEHITDPRNLATLLLYAYLVYVAVAAQPLQLMRQLLWVARGGATTAVAANATHATDTVGTVGKPTTAVGGHQKGYVAALGHARWRLLVIMGLLAAPFFPASNVLFYVGTFIGERLLYMPSIGFCLLLADLLGRLIPTAVAQQYQQQQQQQQDAANQAIGQNVVQAAAAEAAAEAVSSPSFSDWQKQPQQQQRQATSSASVTRLVSLLLLVVLSVAYAGRTVVRNVDWWDEERLFLSAEKVCPNSAKVQQNCGVLQRRYQKFDAAMRHFRRAQEIDPGYCEPSYWIALTRINQGDVQGGLAAMKASLTCKYTAAEALQTLNKLYLMMHEGAQADPMPMLEWARVLASPAVLRVADACATVEDAALLATSVGKSSKYLDQVLGVCWEGLRVWREAEEQEPSKDTMAGLARMRYSALNATLLHKCAKLRQNVYKRMLGHKPDAKNAKLAVYRYIRHVQDHWPGCRTLAGGGVAIDDQEARTPSSHQKLLHRVQSADPEDPWLQLEWGQTLIALGGDAALSEAAMHMEVASAIFTKIMQQLQDVGMAGAQAVANKALLGKLGQITALNGSALTSEAALEAAILSLERFMVATSSANSVEVQEAYCELLKKLCHLRLQMVVLVQQSTAAAGGRQLEDNGAAAGLREASATKLVLNAKAAGRRCLLELSEQRGCEKQAVEMRHMVGKAD